MSHVTILNAEQIEALFTLTDAIESVEQAYLQKHTGQGVLWPMVFHEFERGVADLDIKSGNLDVENVFGLKLVSWFGENPGKDLPALYGTILLFDRATGEPKALLNAGAITELRTGAAAAIGAKYLARKDSRQLLLVGCGGLASSLIAATLYTMPQLERVVIIEPRTPEQARERLKEVIIMVDSLLRAAGRQRRATIELGSSLEEAVVTSDVILTATPSRQPLISAQWVRPGTHLSCVGADMAGKEEVDPQLFAVARVFGDDEGQCLSVGECEIPHKTGVLAGLNAEIGAVIAGDAQGRTSEEDITIFDSTGIALQDLASAAKILNKARQQGLGTTAAL